MIAILLSITLIHFMGLIIPGPDFFFVSQAAVRFPRKECFKGILGITLGVMLWSGLALLGLHLMLENHQWLRHGVIILGASYLTFLASQLFRSAISGFIAGRNQSNHPPNYQPHYQQGSQPGVEGEKINLLPEEGDSLFLKGLLTNLSNPKAIAYFASVFSIFVVGISAEIKIIIYIMVILETMLWFSFVMAIFSLALIKRSYQKVAPVIDGLAGAIFLGFALYFLYIEFAILL